MVIVLFKAVAIWLAIVFAAILNGVFREKVLVPVAGSCLALPLSGVLLSVLVFLVALILIPFIGSSDPGIYAGIGFLWVGLTLAFECLFGHFVAGKSWREILQVFNVRKGDLFVVVLLVTAISPWLAARVRGVL
jgi:hypothetical protein